MSFCSDINEFAAPRIRKLNRPFECYVLVIRACYNNTPKRESIQRNRCKPFRVKSISLGLAITRSYKKCSLYLCAVRLCPMCYSWATEAVSHQNYIFGPAAWTSDSILAIQSEQTGLSHSVCWIRRNLSGNSRSQRLCQWFSLEFVTPGTIKYCVAIL